MTDKTLSKEDALDLIYGSEPENEHAREVWQEMRDKLGGIIDRTQPDNGEIIKKVMGRIATDVRLIGRLKESEHRDFEKDIRKILEGEKE